MNEQKPNKINLKVGKFLLEQKLLTLRSSYNVELDLKTKGFDAIGRQFIKQFLIDKNMSWLQEMMKQWEKQ